MRQCPECRQRVEVLRTQPRLGHTYRRYQCANGHRFSTHEYLSVATNKVATPKPPTTRHLTGFLIYG